MNVIYSDRAKQGGMEYAFLQQASKQLEEAIGAPATTVTAEWDRVTDDRGGRLVDAAIVRVHKHEAQHDHQHLPRIKLSSRAQSRDRVVSRQPAGNSNRKFAGHE